MEISEEEGTKKPAACRGYVVAPCDHRSILRALGESEPIASPHVMATVSIRGHAAIHSRRKIGCLQGGYGRRYSIFCATQLR